MNLFRVSFYAITLILFSYGVSSAQIPPCPCDTAELSNGLTGNEIVDIVCPDGNLGDDSSFVETSEGGSTVCRIQLDNPPSTTYLTNENNVGDKFCEINTDGVLPVTLGITDAEYELCRIRLIAGCGLNERNIPTLSERGLIAMAGLLGIAGLFFVAWRKCLTLEA